MPKRAWARSSRSGQLPEWPEKADRRHARQGLHHRTHSAAVPRALGRRVPRAVAIRLSGAGTVTYAEMKPPRSNRLASSAAGLGDRARRPGGLPAAEPARDAGRPLRRAAGPGQCWWRSTPACPDRRSPTSSITRGARSSSSTPRCIPVVAPHLDAVPGPARGGHLPRPHSGGGDPVGHTPYADLVARGDDTATALRVDDEERPSRSTTPRGRRAAQGRDVHPPRRPPQRPGRDAPQPGTRRTRSTCGRCRCSTATAGAPPGR
jgi:hypothetical protein